MIHDSKTSLTDQLIVADGGQPNPSIEDGIDPMFELLLEQERQFEERVRRLALRSWSVTFACLVIGAVAVTLVTEVGGSMVEALRALVIIVMGTGAVGLVAGIVTSMTWLFRARTPTLKAIERRLKNLERMLST